MFTAFSLLLLNLLVNVTLCSPAPMLAVGEPGPEGLGLAEERESAPKSLVLATVGEGAPSSEGSPTEKDVADTGEVPVLEVEPVSAGSDEAESQESDPGDFLAAAPQEYSKDGDGSDASQGDTVVDAQDVEVESPDQQYDENPVQIEPVFPLETSEGEATDEQTLLTVPDDYAEVGPDVIDEPPPETPEEDRPDEPVPAETEMEEAAEEKSVMEDTGPEEPAHFVLEDPADQEPDTGEEEETVNIVSSDANEAPDLGEEEDEEEETFILEENFEMDPFIEEPEEDSVVLIPVQSEDQVEPDAEETATQESGSQDPAVVGPVDSFEGDLQREEQVTEETISLVDQEKEDAAEGEMEEGGNDDTDDSDPDTAVSVTEATSGTLTTATQDGDPAAATKTLTGPSLESFTSPAAAFDDGEAEGDPASMGCITATDVTTRGDDLKAAGVLAEEEPGALANRGAMLGAVFFTLVCFVIIGFVGVIVSKKLRRLHDAEVKIV